MMREAIFIFTKLGTCETENILRTLIKILDETDFRSMEYTFATLVAWEHQYDTMFYVENDHAIIVGHSEDEEVFAAMPLGSRDTWEKSYNTISRCFEYLKVPLSIHSVSYEYAEWIRGYAPDLVITHNEDYDEYVYKADDLRELKGRNFSQKRNHINRFLIENEGVIEYKKLFKKDRDACMALLENWASEKDIEDEETVIDERKAINVMFKYFDELSLKAGGVYVNDILVGFTIGELVSGDTAHIMIEKCDGNIRGLYPYINQKFLNEEFSDAIWVNREEDLGLPGLRKAKLSYYPDHMVEKYRIMEKI